MSDEPKKPTKKVGLYTEMPKGVVRDVKKAVREALDYELEMPDGKGGTKDANHGAIQAAALLYFARQKPADRKKLLEYGLAEYAKAAGPTTIMVDAAKRKSAAKGQT